MKIKSLIWIAILGIGFLSCNDLDTKPKGQFGDAELFGNEAGVKYYFTGLYSYLPIEDFLFMGGNDGNEGGYRKNPGDPDPWGTWEAQKRCYQNVSGELINSWQQWNNDGPNYWAYEHVRIVNVFINNFPEYRSEYDEATYNALLGEARFLRAYIYSGMVRRYGGVPIVTEVLYPTDPPEKTMLPRDTEYDVYKFIYEDLKFASENMKGDKFNDEKEVNIYRANKWTALAKMSRMMLYAATNAKYTQYVNYGQEQAYVDGLAGISPDKAEEFFRYSYEASKELIEKGPYKLYEMHSDLAYNFAQLFLDKTSKETIFTKNYVHHDLFDRQAFLIGHNWDALQSPNPDMSAFVGSQGYPSLDFMRMFEGFPSLVDDQGYPVRWDNAADIKEGIEPRMRGSIYLNGDQLRGATFNIQRGIYKTFTWEASEIIDGLPEETPNANTNRLVTNDENATYEGLKIIGRHGMKNGGGGENNCLTGAFVRKYINEAMPLATVVEHASFQPWIVFRLGEIYLNLAEAAYELGLKTEANEAIKAIRKRAGCKNLDISSDPKDVNQWEYEQTQTIYDIDVELQFIRDERQRELWCENHRGFDLRRWRNADKVMEQWCPRILSCYYVFDEDKYIYLEEREMSNRRWNAGRNCYYQSIPAGERNRNPKLLQNPLR